MQKQQVKAQPIRLIDVFVLGPFMIWAGSQMRNEHAQLAMVASGFATIVYNWENYKKLNAENDND